MKMAEEDRRPSIVVIGAGIAGVSATQHLLKNGFADVVVLESRDRIGGRICTVQHDGAPLELGAQWIVGGCPANSVFNLANRFRLLGDDVERLHEDQELIQWPMNVGYVYKSDGIPLSEEATTQAYEIFKDIRKEALSYYEEEYPKRKNNFVKERTKLGKFYTTRMQHSLDQLDDPKRVVAETKLALTSLRNCLSLEAGDDLDHVRLELMGSSARLPGGDVVVPRGVAGIVRALAKGWGQEVIKLSHKVTHIDWSLITRDRVSGMPDKVSVTCELPNGKIKTYRADYVICTLPLGVLKRHHTKLFTPALDKQKLSAIENLGCGFMSKVFLEWNDPWWAEGEGGIQLAWDEQDLREKNLTDSWYKGIYNFSEVENQRNFLCCWICGRSAQICDERDDDEVKLAVTQVLRQFTGDPGLPGPDQVHRNPWTVDPNTLGAFTYPTLETNEWDFEALSMPLPSPNDPKLLFAGEATHQRFWSTLHGARLSGLREAQRIMDKAQSMKKLDKEMRKLTSNLFSL